MTKNTFTDNKNLQQLRNLQWMRATKKDYTFQVFHHRHHNSIVLLHHLPHHYHNSIAFPPPPPPPPPQFYCFHSKNRC